jgi:hypothetical protein
VWLSPTPSVDRGVHADVPVAEIMATFAREYPRLVERGAGEPVTRFREEARARRPR